jgi:tight adherence protein B
MAFGLMSLPYLHLLMKKKERMEKFEKQLPEALDLIARALKAGHAFTTGMKLASEEFKDPIGPEFEETLDEINFGLSVSDALKNLAERIECLDLRFFVVSVILQRETGGNLAEIIESLAHLIRERFKFRRKVRVLSAEGKFNAVILVTIPLFLFAALLYVNPEYMTVLIEDPIGKTVAAISIVMMIIGIFFIRRIIDVDV